MLQPNCMLFWPFKYCDNSRDPVGHFELCNMAREMLSKVPLALCCWNPICWDLLHSFGQVCFLLVCGSDTWRNYNVLVKWSIMALSLTLTTDCSLRHSRIANVMGPTWSPSGSCRPQMDPMLAQWTLLSGLSLITSYGPTWLSYVVLSNISLQKYDLVAVTVKHGPNTNFHLQRHYTQCCCYLNSLWIHIKRPYNLRHM